MAEPRGHVCRSLPAQLGSVQPWPVPTDRPRQSVEAAAEQVQRGRSQQGAGHGGI